MHLSEIPTDIMVTDGLIYDFVNDKITGLASIYDCGSLLYPQTNENIMKAIVNDVNKINTRIYNFPFSNIRIDNQKIEYYKLINSLEFDDCNRALIRIVPKIDLDIINKIVDKNPYVSDMQKLFYKTMLKERIKFFLLLLKN